MKLLLDLGNSALKWAIHDHAGIGQLHAQALADGPPPAWQQLPQPSAIGISSVASDAQTDRVIEWCRQLWPRPVQCFTAQAAVAGVHSAYPRPQDLGSDRWMALIASHRLYPGDACIVDAGSALTIDLLGSDGQHQGGFISPGYRAMLSALQRKTGLTPPSNNGKHTSQPGNNTQDCILNGISSSLIGLILKVHGEFNHGCSQIIVTGGDAPLLLPQLPDTTRHVPELVLVGIDTLLQAPQHATNAAPTAQRTDPTP